MIKTKKTPVTHYSSVNLAEIAGSPLYSTRRSLRHQLSVGALVLGSVLLPTLAHADVTVLGSSKAAAWDPATINVTASSNIANGDVMVMFVGSSDTTPITALSGWTQIMAKGPDDISITAFYKVYQTGATKSFNIATHHATFATLISLRGADSTNPVVDKNALKDWGITSQTQNGTGTPKGDSYAPSINSGVGGLLLCGFVWDDPYGTGVTVNGMNILQSWPNGDDGLTVTSVSTTGAATGLRKAHAPSIVSGGGNEIGMAVSIRAATVVNRTPVAIAQSVSTVQNSAKSITLTGSDADGDSLTYAIVTAPTRGTLSGTAPNLTYTPAANYSGADSFTFRVNDGTVNSSSVTVSISVAPSVVGNVVLNPSFESGGTAPTSWTRSGSAIGSSTSAQNGVQSLKISSASSSATQTFAIQSGKTYNISAWIHATGMSTGNAVFDTSDQYDGAGEGQFVLSAANNGWTKYSGSFTASSNSLTLRMFTESAFAGTVYFDNIQVAQVTVPSPWSNNDVGNVGISGSSSYNGSVYTVSGSGSDIQGTADQFQLLSQNASGDCTITARVASMSNTNAYAKAGVMIRNSMADDAAHYSVLMTPTNGTQSESRSATNGSTVVTTNGGISAPYWVRVTRVGNGFTSLISSNGTTWTQTSSATISMGSAVEVGMAVTSHDNTKACTATFDNVSVTP